MQLAVRPAAAAVQTLDRTPSSTDCPKSRPQNAWPSEDVARPKIGSRFREAVPDYMSLLSGGDWSRVEPSVGTMLQRWAERWCNRQLRSISIEDLEEYLSELPLRGHEARDVEKEKVLLRSFFRWAVRCGWTDRNPAEALERNRPPAEHSTRTWTPVQQYLLMEACRGKFHIQRHKDQRHNDPGPTDSESSTPSARPMAVPRYLYPLVLLGLRTGLRLGELLNLRWRHVDLTALRITIPAAETSTHNEIGVPIDGDLRAAFEDILRLRAEEPAAHQRVLEAVGMPLWKGKPDEREILHAFRIVRKKAGIPEGGFDSLRPTFLRNCARAGVPQEDAARLCDWDGSSRLLNTIYFRHARGGM